MLGGLVLLGFLNSRNHNVGVNKYGILNLV